MHFCIQWQITARKEIQCQAYFILNNLMSYIQYRNARRNGKHRVSSEIEIKVLPTSILIYIKS